MMRIIAYLFIFASFTLLLADMPIILNECNTTQLPHDAIFRAAI